MSREGFRSRGFMRLSSQGIDFGFSLNWLHVFSHCIYALGKTRCGKRDYFRAKKAVFELAEINIHMNNSDFYTTLFETARSLGIADSQYAFSKLCGRKQSWFSSAKSVNRPISMNALTTLAVKLDHLPADRIPRGNRNKIKTFQKAIWRLVETNVTINEQQNIEHRKS